MVPINPDYRCRNMHSIFVGMHGAALFHILMMNIDRPKCCAVVEMYHKRWSQLKKFGHPPSVGNMARFLSIKHYTILSNEEDEVETIRKRGKGTVVDIPALKVAAAGAIAHLA